MMRETIGKGYGYNGRLDGIRKNEYARALGGKSR